MVVATATICGVGGAEENPKPAGGSSGAIEPRSSPPKWPVI